MITDPPKETIEAVGEKTAESLKNWLNTEFNQLAGREDVTILKQDVGELKQDVAGLKQDVIVVNKDIAVLSANVEHLEESVREIKTEIKDMRTDMKDMRTDIDMRFDSMNAQMNERFDTMYHQTFTLIKWTVGLLGFFGTLISTLIFVGQFIKH